MKFKIQLITQCETGEEIQELAYLERREARSRSAPASSATIASFAVAWV